MFAYGKSKSGKALELLSFWTKLSIQSWLCFINVRRFINMGILEGMFDCFVNNLSFNMCYIAYTAIKY